MKKYLLLSALAAAAISFTGCGGGGGGGGYVPGPAPSYAILYLDDGGLVGQAGVYYNCTSGDGYTDGDGGIYYYPGDACTLDLTGYPGWSYPLHIDYGDGSGASGIEYDCWFGSSGWTDINGEFYYDADDSCTFYF